MFNEASVVEIITSVLKENGQVLFVDHTEIAPNSDTVATIENLIDVTTDDAGENYEEIFRTKFNALMEEYRKTLNDDPDQNPKLKTNNPVFTYREPAVLEVPNKRLLVSISIGFPFVVQPHLPRKKL